MKADLQIVRSNDHPADFDAHTINKLATALQCAMHIRTGVQLIVVLGSGQEDNNLDALKTWTLNTLCKHRLAPTRHALGRLLVELEKDLKRWELTQ